MSFGFAAADTGAGVVRERIVPNLASAGALRGARNSRAAAWSLLTCPEVSEGTLSQFFLRKELDMRNILKCVALAAFVALPSDEQPLRPGHGSQPNDSGRRNRQAKYI